MHLSQLKYALLALFFSILAGFSSQSLGQLLDVDIDQVYYLPDPHDEVDLESLKADPLLIDQPGTLHMNWGVPDGSVWIRLKIVNQGAGSAKLWLDTGNNHPKASRIIQRTSTDNETPSDWISLQNLSYETNDNNVNSHQTLGAWFFIEGNQATDVIIHFSTNRSSDFKIQLMNETEFYEVSYEQRIKLTLTIGVLFTLSIVSLLFYISSRKLHYLLYTAFELSTIGYLFFETGYGVVSLWPDSNQFSDQLTYVIGSTALLCFIWFGYFFLEISKRLPRIVPLYYTATGFILLSMLFSLDVTWINFLFNYFIPIFIFGFLFFHTFICIIQIRYGQTYVWPYLFGLLAELTPGLTFFLAAYGLVNLSAGSKYDLIYLGIIIEGGLFLVAMNGYLKSLRAEKDAITQKIFSIYQERVVELQSMKDIAKDREYAINQQIIKASELASVSHDIHHNLFDIKLQLAQIKKNDDYRLQVSSVFNSLDYLKGLTQTLIKENKEQILSNREEVDVHGLFVELNETFKNKFLLKGLSLRRKLVLNEHIPASRIVLKRLLENLIRNGLDHTQSGGVLFSARIKQECVLIQVFDTGKGIAEDRLKYLNHKTIKPLSSDQGFGMGFVIVKTLCEQEGYRFSIQSRLGKGTSVSIQIPI